MNKLKVKLKNCYWIKELDAEDVFDFTDSNVYSIYAKNGSMKTSFLKGFIDYTKEVNPKDKIYNIDWSIELTDESNTSINKDSIFPVESLNLEINPNFSSLLVHPGYKEEFGKLYWEIDEQKNKLIRWLNAISKVEKSWMEEVIMKDFSYIWGSFFEFLKSGLLDLDNVNDYEDVSYKIIFSEKAKKLLENPSISSNIKDYKKEYERVLSEYSCFNLKGFTIYKAESLLKEIKQSKYFVWTQNKLNLNKNDWEVKNEWEFSDFIDGVKAKIAHSKNLWAILKAISEWTKEVKDFQEHIETMWHKFIAKLDSAENLKKELWNYYFKQNEWDLNALLKLYDSWIKRLSQILEDAEKYESEWYITRKIFKERFYIDFSIEIENKRNVVVWRIPTANINFIYENSWKPIIHTKDSLLWLKVLSWWEMRVMYLLYVIFEIELRKKLWGTHIIIIDDIADSFDYKNKYAIIEYLREISEDENFKIIILTHNFDFYRTINSRLLIPCEKRLIPEIDWEKKVILQKFKIEKDPFQEWKKDLNEKNIIILIPFVRNLIEYWKNSKKDYNLLTHILHMKNEMQYNEKGYWLASGITYDEASWHFTIKKTPDILFEDIKSIYSDYLWLNINVDIDVKKDILSTIFNIADSDTKEATLENKIILAIAIRLFAENFIITKISPYTNLNKISQSQTWELIKKLKAHINDWKIKDVPIEKVKILDSVNIMTPENIHLNSFMYEPILDMDIVELRGLYGKVKKLS